MNVSGIELIIWKDALFENFNLTSRKSTNAQLKGNVWDEQEKSSGTNFNMRGFAWSVNTYFLANDPSKVAVQ